MDTPRDGSDKYLGKMIASVPRFVSIALIEAAQNNITNPHYDHIRMTHALSLSLSPSRLPIPSAPILPDLTVHLKDPTGFTNSLAFIAIN